MNTKQTLEKEGSKTVVRNSPYGATRKKYGWGTPFAKPKVCISVSYPKVHIGTSSLSCVSGKDRDMQKLMTQYQRKFLTLEHCTTYHGVGDVEAWQKWRKLARKKKGFSYTVKANQYLTHKRNLQMDSESEAHVQHFYDEKCSILGDAFSVGLVQLPSSFTCTQENTSRLRLFATKVPRNVRIAVEFRHHTWFNEETYSILRESKWALVSGHSPLAGTVPIVDTDAGFLYLRLHGALTMYMGDYGDERLKPWVHTIQAYCDNDPTREAFVFFNNSESEVAGLASSVVDATHFAELLDERKLVDDGAKDSLPQGYRPEMKKSGNTASVSKIPSELAHSDGNIQSLDAIRKSPPVSEQIGEPLLNAASIKVDSAGMVSAVSQPTEDSQTINQNMESAGGESDLGENIKHCIGAKRKHSGDDFGSAKLRKS